MKPKGKQSNCELVIDPRKRALVNQATGKISASFPPGLSQPALRALVGAGYSSSEQLATVSDVQLLALHGMGPKAMAILRGQRITTKSISKKASATPRKNR